VRNAGLAGEGGEERPGSWGGGESSRGAVREGERAVDFLREVLSHDLVAARKIENTVRIRERVGIALWPVSMMPDRDKNASLPRRGFRILHD